jgi:oligoendopeptidase F
VPPGVDLGQWAHVEPLFRDLLERPVGSAEALEAWLVDASELAAALSEERSRRYVAMTQQTDDPAREAAYLQFVRDVQPRAEPLWFSVRRRYLELRRRFPLPEDRYFVLDRDTQNAVELFREENVPLRVQEAELEQRYQKVAGGWTVRFRGQEYTVQQMARFLEEPDRATRQEAWEAVVRRRLEDKEVLEDLFDRLVALRHRMAQHAGFPDYRAYAFRSLGRWDYTPEDCVAFHAAVERHVVPLLEALQERRREQLGVDRLRPWDLEVDPLGRPPLRPFRDGQELAHKALEVFRRVHPELGEQFRFLWEEGLLDLESRKGKAPGGYQATFDARRWPFLFMNAAGLASDVRTLVHESGHAFHTLAVRDEPLLSYRHAPTEFSEVASMGMEMLSLPHLDVFYPEEPDRRRARREFFEGVVRLLPWVATWTLFNTSCTRSPGTPERSGHGGGETSSGASVARWTGPGTRRPRRTCGTASCTCSSTPSTTSSTAWRSWGLCSCGFDPGRTTRRPWPATGRPSASVGRGPCGSSLKLQASGSASGRTWWPPWFEPWRRSFRPWEAVEPPGGKPPVCTPGYSGRTR